jgi:hypothetical protein
MIKLQQFGFGVAVISLLTFSACDTIQQAAPGLAQEALNQARKPVQPQLTGEQAAGGLKDALIKGVTSGTDRLGAVGAFSQNAAIKILLPPEIQKIEQKIRDNKILNALIGKELDKTIDAMNAGAEKSMALAVPVFKNAITQMSFADAMGILTGGQGSATRYLKETSELPLQEKFKPEVKKALDEVSLAKIWQPVVTQINKNKRILGLEADVQTDLNQYVTEKATAALFREIEQEENLIRKDPVQRTTELLKKAFDYADKNQK